MFNAHRLVYEAFVGLIPEGMQINHKNGIKDDNRPENLEVVTASENKMHSINVLGRPIPKPYSMPGETNPKAKITWDQVREVRQAYATGMVSQQSIAIDLGLNQSTVGRIVRGEIWKDDKPA